jgi:rhodanese-related sulfurtransferase
MKNITREEIKEHLDNGDSIALVEALPEKSFAEGHLPGALNIMPDKVDDLAPKLLKDKDQMIVTYCAGPDCPKSGEAAKELEDIGYTNVVEYSGGKEDWQQAGYPIEKGTAAQPSAA